MSAPSAAAYTAPCPRCSGDAVWHSRATFANGDSSRTAIELRIDCPVCPSVEEAKEIA